MSESNIIKNQESIIDKFCHRCKITKPKLEFYKDKSRSDGLYSYCKICTKTHVKKWQINNSEKNNLRSREWTKNNLEKKKKSASDWVNRNKEQHSKCCKNWKLNNKGKINSYGSKRRATKLNATPLFANLIEIEKIYAKSAKMRSNGIPVEVDHIIPLIGKNVCGLHVHWNLQIIDKTENRRKGNKLIYCD